MKSFLMTPENAQKCFEGTKTQTRRLIKPQPDVTERIPTSVYTMGDWNLFINWKDEDYWTWSTFINECCPYKIGEQVYIRETWQDYCPMWNGTWCGHGTEEGKHQEHLPVYKGEAPEKWLRDGRPPLKWKPSIHMPAWAARTIVEITDIRAQRVQDISRDDAIAEGIIPMGGLMDTEPWCASLDDQEPMEYSEAAFGRLRNSIHGAGAWERNDWVWAYSFRRTERCK